MQEIEMELLSVLEKQVAALLTRIRDLSKKVVDLEALNQQCTLDNNRLVEKRALSEKQMVDLQEELEMFKATMHQQNSQLSELTQEKSLTKHLIEDLIKSIETANCNEHNS
jgi:uncharacterized protein involved in exopolysaccharide biosynthesis